MMFCKFQSRLFQLCKSQIQTFIFHLKYSISKQKHIMTLCYTHITHHYFYSSPQQFKEEDKAHIYEADPWEAPADLSSSSGMIAKRPWHLIVHKWAQSHHQSLIPHKYSTFRDNLISQKIIYIYIIRHLYILGYFKCVRV